MHVTPLAAAASHFGDDGGSSDRFVTLGGTRAHRIANNLGIYKFFLWHLSQRRRTADDTAR